MSKSRQQGAKSSVKQGKSSEVKKRITTVNESINTTYKVNPITMRLSISDRKLLNDWVDSLQSQTKRKVTPAKIIRALLGLKDEIDQDKLLCLIKEMN